MAAGNPPALLDIDLSKCKIEKWFQIDTFNLDEKGLKDPDSISKAEYTKDGFAAQLRKEDRTRSRAIGCEITETMVLVTPEGLGYALGDQQVKLSLDDKTTIESALQRAEDKLTPTELSLIRKDALDRDAQLLEHH